MEKRLKIVLIGFIILCLICWFIDSCNQRKLNKKLVQQLTEYQIENKRFRAERQKDSSLIVTQNQTIMTQKEAIRLGLLEMDKRIKQVESQLQAKIQVRIIEKDVPYVPNGYADTTGWVKNEQGEIIRTDSISVPQRFALSDKFFNVEGEVKKNGLKIDTLAIPSKFTITYGKEKTGFLNLGRNPVVQIRTDNPYVDVTSLNNIVVKKPQKFYNSKIFMFGVGVLGGFFLAR